MSLTDVMSSDYWLIAELAKAKERLIEARVKAREKAMAQESMKGKRAGIGT